MSSYERAAWVTVHSGVELRLRPPTVREARAVRTLLGELAGIQVKDASDTLRVYDELIDRAVDILRGLVTDWRGVTEPGKRKRLAFDPEKLDDAIEDLDVWDALTAVNQGITPEPDEKKASASSSSGRSGSSARRASGRAKTRRTKQSR